MELRRFRVLHQPAVSIAEIARETGPRSGRQAGISRDPPGLRRAGLLGSMGALASAFDNALAESFFRSMQIKLLDRRTWITRAEFASAIFEWIEGFFPLP